MNVDDRMELENWFKIAYKHSYRLLVSPGKIVPETNASKESIATTTRSDVISPKENDIDVKPRRNVPKVNYAEPEVPKIDRYIFSREKTDQEAYDALEESIVTSSVSDVIYPKEKERVIEAKLKRNVLKVNHAEPEVPRIDRYIFSREKTNQESNDASMESIVTSSVSDVISPKEKEQLIEAKPKRNVPKVNYAEPEVPKIDRYVYCDVCGVEYVDVCPTCGGLRALKNTAVPVGVPDRAKLTVPKNVLEIRSSSIHGLGVFALKSLKQGVRVGPYHGEVTQIREADDAVYGWQLRNGKVVDAADETKSNWLRYVNCSRNMREQNLIAYQYRGNLYYRTCKDIHVGEELLVFYGEEFAKKIGIDVKQYYKPQEQTASEVFFCDFCPMGFALPKSKEMHMSRCADNVPLREIYENLKYWTCRHCKVTITSEEYLRKHEQFCRKKDKHMPSGSQPRVGQTCVAENGTTLDGKCGRVRKNKVKGKFTCHVCSSVLSYKHGLIRHINTKHNKQAVRYHCDQCEYNTVRKSLILRHKQTHKKVKPFLCPLCKQGFVMKQALLDHMDRHVGNLGKWKCQHCQYTTNHKPNLDRHVNNKHTRETVYKCNFCTYTSTQKCHVKRHEMGKHTNQRPYKCQHCSYASAVSSHLRSHIKSKHKGPQTNTNNDKRQLDRHANNKTTGEIVYKCDFCAYTSRQKCHVKTHEMRKHTNQRPHKCQHCPYASATSSDLKSHIKYKHKGPQTYANDDKRQLDRHANNKSVQV